MPSRSRKKKEVNEVPLIVPWHTLMPNGNISIGASLMDTIDDLINEGHIEPQLAMKILGNFDRIVQEVLADKVKARLTFKVGLHSLRRQLWRALYLEERIVAEGFLFAGPSRYLPILRRGVDVSTEGRQFQAGWRDPPAIGEGQDCEHGVEEAG
jgi:Transcription initiation factor IIA, gamma subunit, helical domain